MRSKFPCKIPAVAAALFAALLAAFLLIAGSSCLGQVLPPGPDIPRVKASLIADVKAVQPGTPFKLGVRLDMPAGWHTYYKVSGDAGMPTGIDWALPPGFKAGPLLWQKPHKFNDSGITTYGYADHTLIAATITPPARLPPGGRLTFSARVRWLQCKELCVPGKARVSLSLPVAAPGPVAADNMDLFKTVGFEGPLTSEPPLPAHGSVLTENLHVKGVAGQGSALGGFFFLAFAGGFILNFMPCVLPVISIKVLGFVEQAGEDKRRVLELGLAFTAGILASFLALAGMVIAVQKTGQRVGWGFQFQHPAFVVAMCVIVLLLALSLFGLFYLSPPPGQAAIDRAASREGLIGTFFKGVLATTLSTPCTAPFLGTAVGFAFTQPPWIIVAIFLTVGLGMAFPYLVLTALPDWMRFLPRPGDWMERFKQFLGFLLLATVIWLLRVLGAQVGFEQALWVAAFLLVITLAVWLVSSFTDLSSSERRRYTVWGLALAVTAAGYYFCVATVPGLGRPLPVAPAGPTVATGSDDIDWRPFSVGALDKALDSGQTVFVDFTAEWCLTCKVNEHAVIGTRPVVEKLKALHVVTFKADWTRQDPQITDLLHKFGRSGVPLYVIFPAGRPTEPIVLPEVITQPIVLSALDEAARS